MDIILFNSDPQDVDFYWIDKNRSFVLQKKDFKKDEENFVYHPLKAILDGSYSLGVKTKVPDLEFAIRVKEDILYRDKGNKIYFKIETKPENKITQVDKDFFVKAEVKLKMGVGRSARKLWNLYWFNLHYMSYNYPENPSDEDKKQIEDLTKKMCDDGLGCPRCRAHFIDWTKKKPIKDSYNSKEELITWYFDLHNDVNKRNGKTLFKKEESDKLYSTFRFNDMVND